MPVFIHRDIVEVEQVAAWIVAATVPDTGIALHRSVWSGQGRRPVRAAIVRVRDPAVPRSLEVDVLMITRRLRAEENDRRSFRIAGNCRNESRIVDSPALAYIERLGPVLTTVFAYCHKHVGIDRITTGYGARIGKVHGVIAGNTYGWIHAARARQAVGNSAHSPRHARIG